MARLAIIWRNQKFVQPRRLWTPASTHGKRSVYLVAEPTSSSENSWQGLPNLEVIRCGGGAEAAAQRTAQSGT
jgi:hypothetical protein